MNYAHDPFWAYKDSYSPEKRQAYENQVMMDRAASERHRDEFGTASIITGGLLLFDWFQGRSARKAEKARAKYAQEHCPENYEIRRAEFEAAADKLHTETDQTLLTLQGEISYLEHRVLSAGTAKSAKTMRSRIQYLKAKVESARLAYQTSLDSLVMQYQDIVEYEAGLAQFQ